VFAVSRCSYAHFIQIIGSETDELVVGEMGDGLKILWLVFVGLVPEVDEFFFEGGEDGLECFEGLGTGRLLVL
jgi:hypothetical protein